jgi:hypothetical protein
VLGVPRIKAVADLASLKALTLGSISDGDLRLVTGSGFYGIYRYTSASSATEVLPMIAQPNAGSGRWINILNDLAGAASGLATLNVNSRVVQKPLWANISAAMCALTSGGSPTTASQTLVDTSTSLNIDVSANGGDKLLIDASLVWSTTDTVGSSAIITVTDGSAYDQPATARTNIIGTGTQAHSTSIVYSALSTGTINVKWRWNNVSASKLATAYYGSSIRVQVVRP